MIILPEQFAVNLDDADYVNKCLNDYWDSYSHMTIPTIEARLLGLKTEYLYAMERLPNTEWYYRNGDIVNQTSKFRSYTRLGIGYNLPLFNFTAKKVGFEIYSEGAYILKIKKQIGKNLTYDHIFGTTEIGVQTFVRYQDSNWDLDYITNEYLPQTLYQYLQARILIGEHQKENEDDTTGVARGKHTMEQKIALEHYKGVIPLPLVINRKEK